MASLEYKELEAQLLASGNKLVEPSSSVDELLSLLGTVESCLSKVEQSPADSMQTALAPSLKALVSDKLLGHSNVDVKVAVASCISEITRITAPEAPYEDDVMKEVFQLIVSSFENMSDESSRSYTKRTSILETVAKVRSCVVMLDLECDALIVEMFQHFLNSIRDHHPVNVFSSMETIMALVLEESEDISMELLSPILASVRNDDEKIIPIARRLAEKVLESCATKVKPYLEQAIKTSGSTVKDYTKVIIGICQGADDDDEKNDVQVSNGNMADDMAVDDTSVKSELEKEAKEDKEVADGASSEKVDPSIDGSPQSALSNGTAQTAGDDSLADSTSIKKQEDDQPIENPKDLDVPPDILDPEKEVDTKEKPEQDTEKEEKEASSEQSTKPPESPHVEKEKEDKELPDQQEGQSEDTPASPCEGPPSVEEKDEGSDVKLSPPKASEIAPTDTVPESPSTNALDETLPEKIEPQEKESSDKEAAPPAADTSKKVADVTSDSEVKPSRPSRKKTPVAKYSEVDVPMKEREATSDSEVKPSRPSRKKTPAANSSEAEAKAPSEADVPMKESGATSDSEVKPSRTSRKKTPAANSSEVEAKASSEVDVPMKESGATSDSEVKTSRPSRKKIPAANSSEVEAKASSDVDVPMKESEAASDSEEKPLKQSVKKVGGNKKSASGSSSKQSDKKKYARVKSVSEKDTKKSSAKDSAKDIITSPKSLGKTTKDGEKEKETPKTDLKRKRTPAKEKEPVKDFGQSLVGSKVKVWWPDDHKYYDGTIKSFDPARKQHKVLYTDGDEEVLNLKKERWEFIGGGSSESDEEEETSPGAPGEASPKKKVKTKERTKLKKVEASPKKGGGGGSSSKSKAAAATTTTTPKSRGVKSDGKSKDETSKSVGKSEDQTPKSGSGGTKPTIISFKSSGKSKNTEAQTPNTPVTKSKQALTPKAGKSKSTSKDKLSLGKSSTNGSGKAKLASNAKEDLSDSEDVPESTKGKSLNPSKVQGTESKPGKKRRRAK